MNPNNKFKEKIKDLVYKFSLPIYLWSISFRTLDSYVNALVDSEVRARECKILELKAKNKEVLNKINELIKIHEHLSKEIIGSNDYHLGALLVLNNLKNKFSN